MKRLGLYKALYLLEGVLLVLYAAMVVMSIAESGELRIFDIPYTGFGGLILGSGCLLLLFLMLTSPVLLSAVVLHIIDRRKTRQKQ
jgi:hypothetical protein